MSMLSGLCNIMDFGAVPGGSLKCTGAISAAIDKCTQSGGGTVYIPSGTFLTGPIELKSSITLFLEAGSKLLFSSQPEDYPLVEVRWEGSECVGYMPMIYARAAENISVAGTGTIDGQGEFWWNSHKHGTLAYARPRLIYFESCTRILIENVQLINSPSWTANPVRCQNVTIHNISIKNPADSPNTDGINPDSCRNVRISDCQVDVGDDCITIKSGTEKSSSLIPCENISITNCTLLHGHGGVVIGSEMSGGVRNVVISNCVFEGTDRGIRMKTRRGRGGTVCDIRVSNLIMSDVMCPVVMHQYYFCGEGGKDKKVWDKAVHPVNEETPVFRGIHFSGITSINTHAAAAFIYGLPEMPIEDISFENIRISIADNAVPGIPAMMKGLEPMAKQGVFCCNTRNVRFSGVLIDGFEGPAFQLTASEKVYFASCNLDEYSRLAVVLDASKDVYADGSRLTDLTVGD